MTVGTLAAQAVEALQVSREVQLEWGSTTPVRPCIAQQYLIGAKEGEGRDPSLFMVLTDAVSLGLSDDKLEKIARIYNTRLFPPLQISVVHKILRQARKEKYHPYSCNNPALSAYCIGEDCPHRNTKTAWQNSAVSANGLTRSGWLPKLSAVQVKLFLGLYRIAQLKGRGPRHHIPFTFRELERVSGVNRKYHRTNLEVLKEHGLLSDLLISNEKGKPTSIRFPERLPIPPIDIYG